MFPKGSDFIIGQLAPRARRQIPKRQWPLTNANKPQHLIAEQLCDFTNLTLATFVQHHPDPGALISTFLQLDPRRGGASAIKFNTGAPFAQRLWSRRLIK
jgi:hypothetical protein